MSERHRKAGEQAYYGHRRRQLEELGIDVDRLDTEREADD